MTPDSTVQSIQEILNRSSHLQTYSSIHIKHPEID